MTTSTPALPAEKPVRGRSLLTRRQRAGRLDVKLSPYLYISPFFILFGLIGLFPLIYTFVVSLYDWHLLKGQGDFVGLANFIEVLGDRFFWNSLGNTMSIFLLSSIPQLLAALVIAAILDQNLRGKTFWRMSVLLPYIVTPVAVSLIFTNMFNEQYGLINNLLSNVGIDPIGWKTETLPSHIAIATMVNFRWTGYNALLLLAAMQSVPRDIHESAALDGAGAVRRFFSITIPSIKPTLIFVIITATIGGLQIFSEPRLFDPVTAGGSSRQFQTTVLYLWEMAFFRLDFGKAAAIAWLLFLLIVGIGIVNFLVTRRIGGVEAKGTKGAKRPSARSARRMAMYRASNPVPGTMASAATSPSSASPTPPSPAAESDPAAEAPAPALPEGTHR